MTNQWDNFSKQERTDWIETLFSFQNHNISANILQHLVLMAEGAGRLVEQKVLFLFSI